MPDERDDQSIDEETQRRVEALIRAAGRTPPLRLKDIPRKRSESKRKPVKVAKRSS